MTTLRLLGVDRDEGTVVLFEAEDLLGLSRYLIAVDHRPARAIADALAAGEDVVVDDVEPWQIVRHMPAVPPMS